jgi:hypothetical protein
MGQVLLSHLLSLLAPEDTVVFWEVTLDHGELEGAEDRARWLSLEKEPEASYDEALHVLAVHTPRPTLQVERRYRHGMSRAPSAVINCDITQP